MTKSKAQKARARQQKQKQPKQKQPQRPAAKKPRRRRDRGGRGASDSDHSMVFGGNRGQMRTYAPRVGVIEKRELIQLVSGTTGFQALKFPINPGLPGTFPVGAPEAKNWTEWRCTRMSVEYIPTVSEFATQGQAGEVAIAMDYNAENELPTTMQQIEAMHFAGGGIPSRGFQFDASTKYMNKSDPKYVRFGAPPVGEDLRLYDGGNLYFATNGCTNSSQIGKLEMTYRFEVQLPTLLNQGAGSVSDSAATNFQGSVEAGGATTVAYQVLMATQVGSSAIVNTAGSIVPPAGNYKVDIVSKNAFTGSATVATNQFLKNGVQVGWNFGFAFTAASQTVNTSAFTCLVAANGTDAFTLSNVATYSTGANAVSASVTFTPV